MISLLSSGKWGGGLLGFGGLVLFGFLCEFWGGRKKQLVSDNFSGVGHSVLPPFQCLRG